MTLSPLSAAGAQNFSLLHPDEQLEQASLFSVHSGVSFTNELTHAGFLDVPVTYMLCTEDQTLTPEFQRRMIQQMRDAGAEVDVVEVWSDHCWPACVPRSFARKVVEIVENGRAR